MRRSDRQIQDTEVIAAIFRDSDTLRIAYTDATGLTIVPVSFVAEKVAAGYVLYVHGAKEGRKFNAFSQKAEVAFELEKGIEPIYSDDPMHNSWKYQTVIGNAMSELIDDKKEKAHALTLLVEKHTGKPCPEISDERLEITAVFKFTVTSFEAKAH